MTAERRDAPASTVRRTLCTAALVAPFATGGALAAALAGRHADDALRRSALRVQRPTQAVLLSAARAGTALLAVGERGLVLRSEDEARSWVQQDAPTSVTLTCVAFKDERRGIAIGHGGVVLRTLDAGNHWQMCLDGAQLAQLLLAQARRHGVAGAMAEAERWVKDGPDKPLLALHDLADGRWLAMGAYGLAVLSDDDGATWQPLPSPLDNPRGMHVYALRAAGDTVLAAGEQGLVLGSSDGGRRFVRIATPYRGTFFAADIDGSGRWWLAGLRGNVLSSDDAGATWQHWPVASTANITSSLLRAGELLLSTQSGQVLRARDGALTPVLKTPVPPINALVALKDSALLALTVAGPVRLPALDAGTS